MATCSPSMSTSALVVSVAVTTVPFLMRILMVLGLCPADGTGVRLPSPRQRENGFAEVLQLDGLLQAFDLVLDGVPAGQRDDHRDGPATRGDDDVLVQETVQLVSQAVTQDGLRNDAVVGHRVVARGSLLSGRSVAKGCDTAGRRR